MFALSLSDEEALIRDTARRFAETELRPRLRAHEAARGVVPEVARRYRDLGLDAVDLPASAGGQGLSCFARVLVLEETAAADAAAALALDGAGDAAYALVEAGLAPLAAALRGAGSRAVVFEDGGERFRADGGRISGVQPWVPADAVALAVILQPGRALVVTEGLRAEPIAPCGLDAAGASRLHVENAAIGATIDDPRALARVRARSRIRAAALLVGAARGAHEYSMRYATERTAFGRPIAHHQALAFLIADMATAVAVARLAVWRAAGAIDGGSSAEWEAAAALAEAAEQALFVAPNAVQMLGGHGFMKDHPVEKWMRDIRTLAALAGGRDAAELRCASLAPELEIGLR